MQTITREVFGRLRGLDPVVEEQRMRQDEDEANAELKLVLSPTTAINPLPDSDTPVHNSAQVSGTHGPESERELCQASHELSINYVSNFSSSSLRTSYRSGGLASTD